MSVRGEFEGLTFKDSLELDYTDWQFYEVGVWIDPEGGYYLATDSGCSCPTPWEGLTRDELTGPLTYEQAAEEIASLWKDARASRDRLESWLGDFLEAIR